MIGLSYMRQRIRCRVSDKRGDTLVEALIALLIAALGASLLATMVMTSTNVSASTDRQLARAYEAESSLAKNSDASTMMVITVDGKDTNIKLTEYRSANGEFVRWADENEPIR